MKIIWITDPHLNLIDSAKLDAFCYKITSTYPDTVLIGGDIADSASLVDKLLTLEKKIPCPIYFVLGNHDFYHSSICDVREQVHKMAISSSYLQYLSDTDIVKLTSDTCLIGHDA